jgi:hypothetical protein
MQQEAVSISKQWDTKKSAPNIGFEMAAKTN